MASLQSSMYLIKVKTRKTFYRGREIKMQKSHLCHVSLSDLTALLEICQYEIPEESAKWKIRMTEAEMAGKSRCMYSMILWHISLEAAGHLNIIFSLRSCSASN